MKYAAAKILEVSWRVLPDVEFQQVPFRIVVNVEFSGSHIALSV